MDLAVERERFGKCKADVECFAIACASDRHGVNRGAFHLAGLSVLVREAQQAAVDVGARKPLLVENRAVASVTDDDDFLPLVKYRFCLWRFHGAVEAEHVDVVFAFGTSQAFDNELAGLFREIQDVLLICLDSLDVGDGGFVGFTCHFIDNCCEVAQKAVVICLVFVLLVEGGHGLLCAFHFDHGSVDVFLRKVVHDLHFVEYEHLEWTGPVRADVVVCDYCCGFVRDGARVEFIVNLVGLFEIFGALLIISVVVVEDAQIKVVEKF